MYNLLQLPVFDFSPKTKARCDAVVLPDPAKQVQEDSTPDKPSQKLPQVRRSSFLAQRTPVPGIPRPVSHGTKTAPRKLSHEHEKTPIRRTVRDPVAQEHEQTPNQ